MEEILHHPPQVMTQPMKVSIFPHVLCCAPRSPNFNVAVMWGGAGFQSVEPGPREALNDHNTKVGVREGGRTRTRPNASLLEWWCRISSIHRLRVWF